jgi:small subunit ribosomal protein S21
MQTLARASRGIAAAVVRPSAMMEGGHRGQLQQARGIMVQVRDGNLDRALSIMERKMRSSGMERLIRARTHHHVKDSEKRVLARKALMQRVKSQELGKKLREILIKKIRSVPPPLHQCSRDAFLCPFACLF